MKVLLKFTLLCLNMKKFVLILFVIVLLCNLVLPVYSRVIGTSSSGGKGESSSSSSSSTTSGYRSSPSRSRTTWVFWYYTPYGSRRCGVYCGIVFTILGIFLLSMLILLIRHLVRKRKHNQQPKREEEHFDFG